MISYPLLILAVSLFVNLRTSEVILFSNFIFFYWHIVEILWTFIFLVFYKFSIVVFFFSFNGVVFLILYHMVCKRKLIMKQNCKTRLTVKELCYLRTNVFQVVEGEPAVGILQTFLTCGTIMWLENNSFSFWFPFHS